MLEKKQILTVAKEIFPNFRSNKNWFETLSVKEHDEAIFKLKQALIEKDYYKNIDILSILNLGEVAHKLIKKYSKEEIIEAMIEDSISYTILNNETNIEIGLSLSTLIEEL